MGQRQKHRGNDFFQRLHDVGIYRFIRQDVVKRLGTGDGFGMYSVVNRLRVDKLSVEFKIPANVAGKTFQSSRKTALLAVNFVQGHTSETNVATSKTKSSKQKTEEKEKWKKALC